MVMAAVSKVAQPTSAPVARAAPMQAAEAELNGQIGFWFEGQFHPARNAIDTLP